MHHASLASSLLASSLALSLAVGLAACGDDTGSEGDGTTTEAGSSTSSGPGTTVEPDGTGTSSGPGTTDATGETTTAPETTSGTTVTETETAGSESSGGSTGEPACELDVIELPGDTFYPEGIASTVDGTLYVGSVATGQIVRVTPCETEVETFVDVGTTTRNVVGMIVDDPAGLLWVCDSDFSFMTPPVLQAYDLATGTLVASHDFGAVGFCNDIAIGPDGAVYATDSVLPQVVRVAPADRLLDTPVETSWATDPEFVVGMGEFGLNGIALADDTTLYVVNYQQGELYRIPIAGDGSAGAVTLLTTDATLITPDGLKALAPDRLMVVEQGLGTLSSIDIAGDAATIGTLADNLDAPTTAAAVGEHAWVVLGQLDHLLGLDPAPPTLPFTIVRVPLQ